MFEGIITTRRAAVGLGLFTIAGSVINSILDNKPTDAQSIITDRDTKKQWGAELRLEAIKSSNVVARLYGESHEITKFFETLTPEEVEKHQFIMKRLECMVYQLQGLVYACESDYLKIFSSADINSAKADLNNNVNSIIDFIYAQSEQRPEERLESVMPLFVGDYIAEVELTGVADEVRINKTDSFKSNNLSLKR